jgi:hypothetical protein
MLVRTDTRSLAGYINSADSIRQLGYGATISALPFELSSIAVSNRRNIARPSQELRLRKTFE